MRLCRIIFVSFRFLQLFNHCVLLSDRSIRDVRLLRPVMTPLRVIQIYKFANRPNDSTLRRRVSSVYFYRAARRPLAEDSNLEGRTSNLSALKIRYIRVGLYFKQFQQSCYCT